MVLVRARRPAGGEGVARDAAGEVEPVNFCGNCRATRAEGAKFCPSCGEAYDAASLPSPAAPTIPSAHRKERKSSPVAVTLLLVLVVIGGLYLLNNTMAGISIKCHLLGDYGACLIESFSEPGTIQNILEDIGNSV